MAEKDKSPGQLILNRRSVVLDGIWTPEEASRILKIFIKLEVLSGRPTTSQFNEQITTLHHSGLPGRAGRTLGGDIFLDQDWTNWTLAHELGHRWNNAWGRTPEQELRSALHAGRLEWLKRAMRRFEKWLERLLGKLGKKTRIDWQALWYHPGDAPPPCGVDRNFNAGEDLAECFAASLFPDDARARAAKAAGRLARSARDWDWGSQYDNFEQTQRGSLMKNTLKNYSSNQDEPE